MNHLAARAGRWSAAHWKTAVFCWLLFVVAAFLAGNATGTREADDADAMTGESGRAERILAGAGFDEPAAETVLVQSAGRRAADPAFQAVLADVAGRLRASRDVRNLRAPVGLDDAAARGLVSEDGRSALVTFDLAGDPEDAAETVAPSLAATAAAQQAHPDWVIVQFGAGSADRELDATIGRDFERAEHLSVPATLVVLVVAFGALVAASVPVLLAFSGVTATLGLSALISHLLPADEVTASVILLVGMAVGVDYSLFYLRREREERAAGRDARDAIGVAASTSGHAVLISGATVVVAMAGLLLAGNQIFTSIGVGAMLMVLVAVIGSLSVLPAMLAKLGHRVEKGRLPLLWRLRSSARAEGRIWPWILGPVLRRPALSAGLAGALLVALALPTLGMRTELPSFTDLPKDLPIVRAYERIQAAFPGQSSPAVVVLRAPDVTAPRVEAAVAGLRDRALASGRMRQPIESKVNPDGTVTVVSVPLAGDGTDGASMAALRALREDVVPATVGRLDGVTVAVTGETAATEDFNQLLRRRSPIVFGFVLGLAFLLLLVTFRSLVIPAKTVLLNLLSVGASYGILVAVFQYGWGASLIGATPNGAVVSWLPIFLFVILFGLSMDYHVFILSRVKELVDGGMRTREAVERGIRTTAGTVTAAAVVMVAVFAIFATVSSVDLKQTGFGLAVAVLLDATIIRAVLLPATMQLLGEWNWYLPRWLRWLPHLGGRPVPPAAATDRRETRLAEPAGR